MKTQERTQINDISKKDTKQVLIEGFIQTIRDQGKIKFLILRDVSGILQCVVTNDCADFEKVSKLKVGNGAAVVTRPPTGEILAMVGSKNFNDENYVFFEVINSTLEK